MVYDDDRVGAAEMALSRALRQAHRRAGEPSSRSIATAIGGMSHTTVNSTLKGTKVPSWPILAKIVEHLGGDLPEFQRLWIETREDFDRQPDAASRSEVSVFVSYAPVDNDATHGRVVQLVSDVGNTYESMTGRTVGTFLDIASISPGENWKDRIRLGLSSSSIFLAFVTPAFLRNARCREEIGEFFGFLDANSSTRLVLPLLYADRDRIDGKFANDPLWKKIAQREPIDISGLRFVDVGSANWLRETARIAEAIEDILGDEPSALDDEETPPPTTNPAHDEDGLIDQFEKIESKAPLVLEDMDTFTQLLNQLGEATTDATPRMNKATSFSQKLALTNSLATTLGPIASSMRDTTERLAFNFSEWDALVTHVISQAKSDPDFYRDAESVEFLSTVHDLSTAGVESLASVEELNTSIGTALGFSKRLDIPLRTVREACLSMADLRGLLVSWRSELEALEEAHSDL